MLTKVISGGQTGADQAALQAAKVTSIPTGGYMPRGFRTDNGPMSTKMVETYGMQATASSDYRRRTSMNVEWADATLIFGNPNSPGCRLTANCCVAYRKSWIVVLWASGAKVPSIESLVMFLRTHDIKILNVAGNRERTQPGIYEACYLFLFDAFTTLTSTERS